MVTILNNFAVQALRNLKQLLHSRYEDTEQFIQANPQLGLTHRATVGGELRNILSKLTPDADSLLSICGITPQELGGYKSNQNKVKTITLSHTTLQELQDRANRMSRKALIGHVPRNPGPQILREWAQKSLHGSFQSLSMLGGGFFEIFFAEEEGRTHALARQHYINQTEVCFTPWRSNFNPRAGTDPNSRLAHPAWAQIHGLPTLLEYNGLPTQCNRCRSTTHQVRNCPIPKPAKEHKQARLTKAHNPE